MKIFHFYSHNLWTSNDMKFFFIAVNICWQKKKSSSSSPPSSSTPSDFVLTYNIKLQSGFPNFQMEALLNDFDYTWHPVEMWGTTNALCDSRTPAYTTSKASCQCWFGAWPGEVNTLILIMTSMCRISEMSRTGTSDLQHQRMVVT